VRAMLSMSSSEVVSGQDSAGFLEFGKIGRVEDDVEGKVEEPGPARRSHRRLGGTDDVRVDLIGVGNRSSVRERCHEGHVVDLLEGSLSPSERRGAPGQHQDRRAVESGLSQGAHHISNPGPCGHRGHAKRAGEPSPTFRCKPRGLLVPDVDDPDAILLAAVKDGEYVPARQGEDVSNPQRLQGVGNGESAVTGQRPDGSRFM
jgi:hypothetical protein